MFLEYYILTIRTNTNITFTNNLADFEKQLLNWHLMYKLLSCMFKWSVVSLFCDHYSRMLRALIYLFEMNNISICF